MPTTAAASQSSPSCTDLSDERRQEIPVETVVPARKGKRSSPCFGEVVSMHGTYGWIKPLQPVDHKDLYKRGEGHIYLNTRDMRREDPKAKRGEAPPAKSIVKFFLYVDRTGLGAEDCHVVVAGDQAAELDEVVEGQCASGPSWESHWQPRWAKTWQPWSGAPRKQHFWTASSTSRPDTLVMVRPEQLLQASPATPMCLASSFGRPEKPRSADAASDDSTSVGDSASEAGDEHEGFPAPPGLQLPGPRMAPPPGLALIA